MMLYHHESPLRDPNTSTGFRCLWLLPTYFCFVFVSGISLWGTYPANCEDYDQPIVSCGFKRKRLRITLPP